MAKTVKAKSAEQAPVVESAPAQTAAPKVKKVKAPKEASAPVVEAPKVEQQVSSESAPVDAVLSEKSTEFFAKLQQVGALISALKTEFRLIEKQWSKEKKAVEKLNSKHKRKSGNRKPSGFVKPTRISDELAKFLDKPIGSEMARTDVTKDINLYIRTHKLQDATNGRKIIPDKKLATLLKIKQNEELTYFNLQKFMSIHFAKAGAKATPELVAGGGVSASA
jgi:chromatin remodeling complex protein RSC6